MATGQLDPQALNREGSGYNANINGLRGLCVALVFVFHLASSGLPPAPAADASWQLALAYAVGSMAHGVEIFFMISGYVIVLSLRRHASLRDFLIDRCLRIFPLWMPMALLIGLVSPWFAIHSGTTPTDAPAWPLVVAANLLLLPPLLPLPLLHPASWSLTVEWLFYLGAAGAAGLLRGPRLPRALRWLAVAALAGAAAALLPVTLCFAVGVAVALAPPWLARPVRRPGLAAPALMLFLLLWRSVDAAGLEAGFSLPSLLREGQALPLLGALFAGAVGMASLSAPGSSALPLLRTPLLQRLGTISYSFYLWHLLAMFAAKRALSLLAADSLGRWAATLLFAALSLSLSWLLAALSWRWVEQGLGRTLRQRLGRVKPRRVGLAV
jgi:peptidoglycan/LPS O-acetylase OafA/YrhL